MPLSIIILTTKQGERNLECYFRSVDLIKSYAHRNTPNLLVLVLTQIFIELNF